MDVGEAVQIGRKCFKVSLDCQFLCEELFIMVVFFFRNKTVDEARQRRMKCQATRTRTMIPVMYSGTNTPLIWIWRNGWRENMAFVLFSYFEFKTWSVSFIGFLCERLCIWERVLEKSHDFVGGLLWTAAFNAHFTLISEIGLAPGHHRFGLLGSCKQISATVRQHTRKVLLLKADPTRAVRDTGFILIRSSFYPKENIEAVHKLIYFLHRHKNNILCQLLNAYNTGTQLCEVWPTINWSLSSHFIIWIRPNLPWITNKRYQQAVAQL